MRYELYTVIDRVAEEAGPVFQAVNVGIAQRNFRQLMSQIPEVDKDSYVLVHIGSYDSERATVEGFAVPEEVSMVTPKAVS